MLCPICGRNNPNYAVVCEQCGNFLPREEPGKKVKGLLDPLAKGKIRCSYCWSDNEATESVCRMCGMPLGFVPYADSKSPAPGLSDQPVGGMPSGDEFYADPGEEDLYGASELNDFAFWEQATKDLSEDPATFETPEVNVVPENVTPVADPVPEGMVRCRACGKDNDRTATHCEFCGQKLPVPRRVRRVDDADYEVFKTLRDSTITCVYCGQEQEWSSITCPSCGCNPRVGRTPFDDDEASRKAYARQLRQTYFGKSIQLDIDEKRRAKEEERRKIEDSQRRGTSTVLPPGARRCRACWYVNPGGTEICQSCGKRLPSGVRVNPKVVVGAESAGEPELKPCTCGYGNLPEATVCAKCGGAVKRKCPHCGYYNFMNVTICTKCHTRLAVPKRKIW